jgi:hypothetical protein
MMFAGLDSNLRPLPEAIDHQVLVYRYAVVVHSTIYCVYTAPRRNAQLCYTSHFMRDISSYSPGRQTNHPGRGLRGIPQFLHSNCSTRS